MCPVTFRTLAVQQRNKQRSKKANQCYTGQCTLCGRIPLEYQMCSEAGFSIHKPYFYFISQYLT